jgi:uncharacterized membrane protein
MKRSFPFRDLVFLSLALVGFALNLWLLVGRLADPSADIAGCGGGSCDVLRASRWAEIFGVPVTLFGLLAYAGLMFSITPAGHRLKAPLLGAVAGAALWFVFAQAVLLGEFCAWCMAAHGVGVLLVSLALGRAAPDRLSLIRRTIVWAAAAFLGIGLCQVYGPVRESHRVVAFDGGRRSFDVAANPRLGPADADRVLVEYFDYQCAACRTMAGHIEALIASHPGRIAVLMMPAPLDGECNHALGGTPAHLGSCAIARVALAVWRVRPDDFPRFHRALIAEPSEAAARRMALELMPAGQLSAALADPWIDESIRSNIAAWRDFSKSTDKLPKLLIRGNRILHGLPSGEADFIRVMERELDLQ